MPKSRVSYLYFVNNANYFISLPCLIGRGEEADLVLADHTVSHRHALIDSSDDQLWIKDLDSVNGVWLNGERISEKTLALWYFPG